MMVHDAMDVKNLTIERIFEAPRELVWKAWTDARHLARWWGSNGFTNPVCEIDLKPGGTILIHMTAPDGAVHPMKGVIHEIVEPERFVFTNSAFEDAIGNPQIEMLNTITFDDYQGKTKLTLNVIVVKATPSMADGIAGMEQGWNESLSRLAATLI